MEQRDRRQEPAHFHAMAAKEGITDRNRSQDFVAYAPIPAIRMTTIGRLKSTLRWYIAAAAAQAWLMSAHPLL
jgi:hypothetical protein